MVSTPLSMVLAATATVSGNFATDICSATKAKGISVYTVGLELNKKSAKDVMNFCASNTGNAYLAEDGNALDVGLIMNAAHVGDLVIRRSCCGLRHVLSSPDSS